MSLEVLHRIAAHEREPLQDRCGLVAAYGPDDFMFLQTGSAGLKKLKTRGNEGAGGFGMSSSYDLVFSHKKSGKVADVFNDAFVAEHKKIKAQLWLFQSRYGTSGDQDNSDESIQPLHKKHDGTGDMFILGHNGQFPMDDRNASLSDTVFFAEELAESEGKNWEQRIRRALKHKGGAFSLTIGTPEGLFLIRDPRGIRPLSYGKYWDDQVGGFVWVAASETNALSRMGISKFTEVLPGQIVHFSQNGQKPEITSLPEDKSKLCIFEDVYTGHGNSKAHLPRTTKREINNAPTGGEIRFRSGVIMAREAPLSHEDVDFVTGIPGTAISGGKGFAKALDLPYEQAINDRDHPDDDANERTFMMADVNSIYGEVLKGFAFDVEKLRGKKIALVDDSIVRNNVMRAVVEYLLNECGVEEIHVRVLCPPIEDVCILGLNTRKRDELVAARVLMSVGEEISDEELVEYIRQPLKVSSLAYLSLEGLKESQTGDPHDERFCSDCMRQTQAPPLQILSGSITPVEIQNAAKSGKKGSKKSK